MNESREFMYFLGVFGGAAFVVLVLSLIFLPDFLVWLRERFTALGDRMWRRRDEEVGAK